VLPPVPGGPGESGLDSLIEQVQETQSQQDSGLWRSMTTQTLEGAGDVVRAFGVQQAQIDKNGTSAKFVFMHTFVPLDNAVLLVACASPAVDVADTILELFGSVTDSLVVTKEDEE
jgi:hypothetical protein